MDRPGSIAEQGIQLPIFGMVLRSPLFKTIPRGSHDVHTYLSLYISPPRVLTSSFAHLTSHVPRETHLAGSILLHSTRRRLSPKDCQLYKWDARCLKHVRRNRTGASSRPRASRRACFFYFCSFIFLYSIVTREREASVRSSARIRKEDGDSCMWLGAEKLRNSFNESSIARDHEAREKLGLSGSASRDGLAAKAHPRRG